MAVQTATALPLRETAGEGIFIELELEGVDPRELSIAVSDHAITITGPSVHALRLREHLEGFHPEATPS